MYNIVLCHSKFKEVILHFFHLEFILTITQGGKLGRYH